MSKTNLIIGIPSKGRLQENTNSFFDKAGMKISQTGGSRGYSGSIKGIEGIEVAFLSASEIVKQLAVGKIHLGVSGKDLVYENISDAERAVYLINPLEFGFADVVVAVPQGWIDVSTMLDLEDVMIDFYQKHRSRMRVATKYINLTRDYFARHRIADYRIVESLGATEGAPAAGSAELIVDITTTGATLAANNLKILDDGIIMKSQAHLIASMQADWSNQSLALLKETLKRISAQDRAAKNCELRFSSESMDAVKFEEWLSNSDCVLPFGLSNNGLVTLHCKKGNMQQVVSELQAMGIETITVGDLLNVFTADNPLFEDFISARSRSKNVEIH